MLYMTALNSHDTYTAHRAMTEETSPDGGLYIPFQVPYFDSKQLRELASKGSCETIAQILNLFLSVRLNAWDVQICVGRNPVRISNTGRKVLIAEAWGNPGNSYEYAVSSLNDRLLNTPNAAVSSWTRIAIGIAFAFGIYAELYRTESLAFNNTFDVCVPDGDLSQPVAMLYARKMGLPVGKIIVCSKDNGAIWDLVNHGQLNLSRFTANKLGMQRLLNCVLGQECAIEYMSICNTKGVYSVQPELQRLLSDVLFAAVVGDERIGAVAENIGAAVAPDVAICYAGLQDFRACTGQGRPTVLIGYTAPN